MTLLITLRKYIFARKALGSVFGVLMGVRSSCFFVFICMMFSLGTAVADQAADDGVSYAYCQHLVDVYKPHSGGCHIKLVDSTQYTYSTYDSFYGFDHDSIDVSFSGDLDSTPDSSLGAGGISEKLKSQPIGTPNPEPCSFDGDPVNFLNGNEYQREVDYQNSNTGLRFERFYNSHARNWTYSYSRKLDFNVHPSANATEIYVLLDDGTQLIFELANGVWVSVSGEGALLPNGNGWVLKQAQGEQSFFDSSGKLLSVVTPDDKISIVYSDARITRISNLRGDSIILNIDSVTLELLSAQFSNSNATYSYDDNGNLTKVVRGWGSVQQSRLYIYDSPSSGVLLTGVVDERGVRVSTWEYDDIGRVISSRGAGGVGKIIISYGDTSSSVTNELGRVTRYRFKVIHGLRHIVSIEGQPTPSCPASNMQYAYDDLGRVISKVDALGNKTMFAFNEYGLETEVVEAGSKNISKITRIDWDLNFFIPLKITSPTRALLYTYDPQGRQLTRVVMSN